MKRAAESMRRWIPVLLMISFLGGLSLSTGCSEDSSTNPVSDPVQDEAPPLPPATTICPGLEQFPGYETDMTDAQVEATSDAAAGENWINAAARVSVLSTASVIVLTPAATALGLAVSTEPVADGPSTYVWTYEGTFDEQVWQLTLTARITFDGYLYELVANSDVAELPLEDALWFEGDASLDLTSGTWRVYDPLDPAARETYEIGWSLANSTVTLDLTVVDPLAIYVGTALTWSANQIDCAMDYALIESGLPGASGSILWETETGAGSIQATDYKNEEKSCWNESREDVVCE